MLKATLPEIKKALLTLTKDDLVKLCLDLSKFKRDNKELLCYLLFESDNENMYIAGIKEVMDDQFEEINTSNYHYMKKGARKVLRNTKKYIRYSKKTATEVELLLYYCYKLKNAQPSIEHNNVLLNLHERTLNTIEKSIHKLHEDLQYDYNRELETLKF